MSAQNFANLNEKQAHSTRGGVDENGVEGTYFIAVAGEVMGGKSLKKDAGGNFKRDRVGEGNDFPGRRFDKFGIGPGYVSEGHPLTQGEVINAATKGVNDPGSFMTQDKGSRWFRGILTTPAVN